MGADFSIDDILAEVNSFSTADRAQTQTSVAEQVTEEPVGEQPEAEYAEQLSQPAEENNEPAEEYAEEYPETDYETGDEYDEYYEDEAEDEEEPEIRRPHAAVRFLLGLVFLTLSVAIIAWAGLNLSLDHGTAGVSGAPAAPTALNLTPKLDMFVNNSTADALSDLTFIRKIYTIPREATVAPAPNPEGFGKLSIEEADKMLEIIDRARSSGLLDGQDVIFSTDVNFYQYSDIEYYYDDTILVIAWKELINDRICSLVEVKVADASQLRRKLVNDSFGDPTWQYASELSNSVNAVAAMNADFYAFPDRGGISVYDGWVCRYETSYDILYIDANGDFITQKRGSFEGRDATQQFVYDNNILFSLAFGPVIVENGEAIHVVDGYSGLGEMNEEYSRAAIAQYDKLHYLYMTVNHASPGEPTHPRANIVQFADIVASKGVQTAYNLDGGQTSEIFFQGNMFNRVDWGNERTVSDIIYFATALPEDQR